MQNKAHGPSLLRKEADSEEVVTYEEQGRAQHAMGTQSGGACHHSRSGGAVTSLGKWQMQSQ